MKLIKLINFSFMATILTFSLLTTAAKDGDNHELPSYPTSGDLDTLSSSLLPPMFLRGTRRALATRTCANYPQICQRKGSPGPDCCKKQCVSVMTDPLNCGKCGKKCKYSEVCCGGRCVNLNKDEKNCGSCNKKCKKGDLCVYGLCNYA